MARRDRILAAVGLLLGGLLIGWLVISVGDDEPDTEVSTSTTTSTSTLASTTVDPASTVPTTSPAATVPATTIAPEPVARLTTGEILGLPLGTAPDTVLAAMNAIYGAPGSDSGWSAGCPLDGGPDDHERVVSYGNLRIRFDRWDQPEQLAGWGYTRRAGGAVASGGPTPGEIELHPEVSWDMTGNEAAAALGVEIFSDDVFGITFIGPPEGGYRSDGLDGVGPLVHVGHLAGDICE